MAALETAQHTHTRAHMGGLSHSSPATTTTPTTTVFHAAGGGGSCGDESSSDRDAGDTDGAGGDGGGDGDGGGTASLRPWKAWLKKERGGGGGCGGGSAGGISGGLARKLPDLVYQAERLEAELLKLKAACVYGGGSGNNSDSNGGGVDGGGPRALWHRLHRALAGLDATFAHSLAHARSGGTAADGGDGMHGSDLEDDDGGGGAGKAARGLPSSQGASSRRGRKVRLRSRNRTVDDWLEDEDGTDAYADLEDFIV